ncbi:MAG TPA: GGDEF domain-containing protein [Streptosporangiaceae bacterium]|nr:GGDEF domain-containing protein [Streptosporangiaceae bacterium]
MTEWSLWRLPTALRLYVCGVIAAAVAAAGWTAVLTSWRARDVALFGLLTGFGVVVVELGRKSPPEPAGLIKDVIAAWLLPTAILLPAVYGLAASALTFTLLQARTRRTIAHRRVFSAAAYGLTSAAISAGFHALPVTPGRTLWWLLAAVIAAVAWLMASTALTGTAGWLFDRTVSLRSELLGTAPLLNDVCEMAAGVLVAALVAGSPVLLLPALPLVVVLQRSFRAVQLDTRRDSLTGLLGPVAWRSETEVQFAQAQRTGSPLTIGIVHLDPAGDHRGPLARDTALAAAGATVRASLRPYDLTGRMGQQIVFALPGTTADEARQIATRLRDGLAARLDAAEPGQEPVCVAVTLGLAATDAPAQTDLTGLLATADAALYRAKQEGQHHVCLDTSPATPDDTASGSGTTPGDGREEIAAARRALGALLAQTRKAAGLTQESLRRRIGYGRSTVADAESAESDSSYRAEFWEACDHALDARGELIAAHGRLEVLKAKADARRRAAKQDQRRRAAAPENTGNPASGVALADGACPHCGEPLTGVLVTARITGVLPRHAHLPD